MSDNFASVNHGLLPPSWRTLYELTRLTPEQFQAGLDRGVIHADMERKDVEQLKDGEADDGPTAQVADDLDRDDESEDGSDKDEEGETAGSGEGVKANAPGITP